MTIFGYSLKVKSLVIPYKYFMRHAGTFQLFYRLLDLDQNLVAIAAVGYLSWL